MSMIQLLPMECDQRVICPPTLCVAFDGSPSKSASNNNVQQPRPNSSTSTTTTTDARRSLLILGAIFLASVLAMSFVYMKFPHLEE